MDYMSEVMVVDAWTIITPFSVLLEMEKWLDRTVAEGCSYGTSNHRIEDAEDDLVQKIFTVHFDRERDKFLFDVRWSKYLIGRHK